MITCSESAENRVWSMWGEAGVQFRSNVVTKGGEIRLHAHNYDHVALITQGWFAVREVLPDGSAKEYQMASKDFQPSSRFNFHPVGYRLMIPAWYQHSFTLLEGEIGEVLCFWGDMNGNG